MGIRRRGSTTRQSEATELLVELKGPIARLAEKAWHVMGVLRDRRCGKELDRIDHSLAFLERAVALTMADLDVENVALESRHVQLTTLVETTIAESPERDRTRYNGEPALVAVDVARASIACAALLYAAGECALPAAMLDVRTSRLGLVEVAATIGSSTFAGGFAVSVARRIACSHAGDLKVSEERGVAYYRLRLPLAA